MNKDLKNLKKRQNTKDSHYVPKFYLKNFVDKNLFLHKIDLERDNNYYFTDNLSSECEHKNIYLVRNKITDIEISCYSLLLGNNNVIERHFCGELAKMLNDELGKIFEISINSNLKIENEFNTFKDTILNNSDLSRKQESLYTYIENDFQPIYETIIKNGNLSSFKHDVSENILLHLYVKMQKFIYQEAFDDIKFALRQLGSAEARIFKSKLSTITSNNYYSVLHYMLSQYFRTKKMIKTIGAGISLRKTKIEQHVRSSLPELQEYTLDENSIVYLFVHNQPILMLKKMLIDNYHLVLISNQSKIDFIISDNPCVNTYIKENKTKYENDELEIYFPLTNKLALFFTKKEEFINQDKLITSDDNFVDTLNKVIRKNADRYIYGNSEKLLRKYV